MIGLLLLLAQAPAQATAYPTSLLHTYFLQDEVGQYTIAVKQHRHAITGQLVVSIQFSERNGQQMSFIAQKVFEHDGKLDCEGITWAHGRKPKAYFHYDGTNATIFPYRRDKQDWELTTPVSSQ